MRRLEQSDTTDFQGTGTLETRLTASNAVVGDSENRIYEEKRVF